MAFCMGSKTRSLMASKKQQSKSQMPQKLPQTTSPILQTERQIKENLQRDQALQIMSQRKKKSFVIKSSVQQTRFSKKDIKDLKQRFEKHSTWVLVDSKGNNIEDQKTQDQTLDYQSQLKALDQDRSAGNQSNQRSNSNNLKTFSQSSNTSIMQEKPTIQPRMIMKGNYKKIEISLQESLVDYGIHYVRKMSKQQFRSCMGLLGLESNAFLSDRIFEVVDTDHDSYITFAQFATIMDTLINGEDDEKHEFSFSLLDVYDSGYFDFEEFTQIMTKIIAHWCIITGSQVKVEKDGLKEIFDRMDQNKDGIVDIDEYKQALKGNSQLFEWFDLLNQGLHDGKKNQRDIADIKIKALTDVLELQQKLNKVLNQIQNSEIAAVQQQQNQKHNDYVSSKMSSSQMSNFGSAFSNQKRDSFKIEDFDQNLQRNYEQNQMMAEQEKLRSNQKQFKSDDIDNALNHLQLRYLLNNEESTTPKIDDMGGRLIQNNFTFSNLLDQQNTEIINLQSHAKKALKIDSQEYKILEMKKQQDLLKLRKREMGEKKAHISGIQSKTQKDDSDNDIIDDPESPQVNKAQNQSITMQKLALSKVESTQQPQYYQSFGGNPLTMRNRFQQQTIASRTQSPLIKLQQTYLIGQEIKREHSSNSANSQMKPEQQQSSQANLFQQNSSKRMSRNHGIDKSFNRQLTDNQSKQGITNQMSSDWSPSLAQDGVRSELNNAQGGGPTVPTASNNKHSSLVKPLSDVDRSNLKHHSKSKKRHLNNSFIEEIVSQHSDNYQLLQQNQALKTQQAQIMTQLNDIQTLANHLLSQLQEDKDSVIGEQIKEYVDKQKSKLLKNGNDSSDSDNDEQYQDENGQKSTKQLHRISLNFDDGNLRPLNEIQTFFKVRSRQRLHESIKKQARTIHKPLSKQKDKSFIHIGHDNWNLVLHMMLGIRQSVRNVMHEEAFELIEQDFERKYCYELVAKKTKNMNLFEFFDFSPRVFHLIRNMYGITPDQYLKSIGPENLIGNLLMGNISSLKEQCSTGKSGSFFYYTADSNFMLKTISCGEFHNLRDILKEYYDHLAMYPHTLITRFFGLHKIRYNKGQGSSSGNKVRIYFVIMANVFKTSRDINIRYDLKGSTQGRRTKKNEGDYVDPSVALKDLDFLEANQKIKVSPDIQKALQQQMQDDVRLFQKLNINDYSLLLGVHYLQDEEEARSILQNSPSIHQIIRNSFEIFSKRESGRLDVTYNSQKLMRPPIPFYEAHDGGIVSADGKCVYFIGIIDTLTFFGTKKKLEYRLKSVAYGNKTISCIPPKNYGDRFLNFMKQIFQ